LFVPAVDAALADWRNMSGSRFVPDGIASEMPAHITLLYPFLPRPQLDTEQLTALPRIAAATPSIDLRITSTGRFPGVLWLDPASIACERLIEAVRTRWPQHPPYGSPDFHVIPHLTVLRNADEGTMKAAEVGLRTLLPLRVVAERLSVVAYEGERWIEIQSFPLQPLGASLQSRA
jgi:2'-5' RNA ligase